MKILLTGGSSFTGYWFARALLDLGHDVCCTLRGAPGDYAGVRGERVRALVGRVQIAEGCTFGTPAFLRVLETGGWDVLCHHAAEVANYRSAQFDWQGALAANTRALPDVLDVLAKGGGRRVVLTGSAFERGEGRVDWPGVASTEADQRAFSPYGLSKTLTAEVFRHDSVMRGLRLAKFVIPNPFGPLEEPRFSAHLLRCWLGGRPAEVQTPEYVRDNIHVSLLARAYAAFVSGQPDTPGFDRCAPSGYAERQGDFAERFASEMRPRLGVDCALELAEQRQFEEPRVRINTDRPDPAALGWDERVAWDDVAAYARQAYR